MKYNASFLISMHKFSQISGSGFLFKSGLKISKNLLFSSNINTFKGSSLLFANGRGTRIASSSIIRRISFVSFHFNSQACYFISNLISCSLLINFCFLQNTFYFFNTRYSRSSSFNPFFYVFESFLNIYIYLINFYFIHS